MMKLKHLFNNEDLALMILKNWDYDTGSTELFKYYRISANAVYPFKANSKTNFLRFAPTSEKSIENVLAELEFIKYLKLSGYTVVEALPSKNNSTVELVQTPWGEYIAEVFQGVPGIHLEESGFEDDIVFGYGAHLGKLHKLSSEYEPKIHKRWSWEDVLEWVCDILSEFPDEKLAAREAIFLKEYLSALPVNKNNYGLVHYDFESDNVFYDAASNSYYPIDFDDAMYHWYTVDIEQALDSIKGEIEGERYEHAAECFIDGYRSQFDITDEMLSLMPVFRRFINLYGYARVLRSTAEKWDNEPEWMINLRGYLVQSLNKRAVSFGNV